MASLGTTAVQSDANEFRKQAKALAEIERARTEIPRVQGRAAGDRPAPRS